MIYTFNDGYCPHKVQPKKCHVQNILRKVYGWDFWRSSTELTSLITPQFQVEPNPKRLMAGSQKITQLKRKIIWTQTHHFPASSCFHPPGDKKPSHHQPFNPSHFVDTKVGSSEPPGPAKLIGIPIHCPLSCWLPARCQDGPPSQHPSNSPTVLDGQYLSKHTNFGWNSRIYMWKDIHIDSYSMYIIFVHSFQQIRRRWNFEFIELSGLILERRTPPYFGDIVWKGMEQENQRQTGFQFVRSGIKVHKYLEDEQHPKTPQIPPYYTTSGTDSASPPPQTQQAVWASTPAAS